MGATASMGMTGSQEWLAGKVSGAVLATIRGEVGLTQEMLAERCGKVLNTVQAWESGRRPLTQLRYADLQRLRRALQLAGAAEPLLTVWDQALRADTMLEDMDNPELGWHPLALTVPDRVLTDLLAWPLTGEVPRHLPATAALAVPRGVRDGLADTLRATAELARDGQPHTPMIRRQVEYLLAGHAPSRSWVVDATRREHHRARDLTQWTPQWVASRSVAVSAAMAGDTEPMDRFVTEGLSTDEGMDANLNYWAYWSGEVPGTWSTDAEMVTADQASWSGHKLLGSLLKGIERQVPYRDLSAHSVWALLRRKRELLAHPQHCRSIADTADKVLTQRIPLSESSRRRMEQVAYLVQ